MPAKRKPRGAQLEPGSSQLAREVVDLAVKGVRPVSSSDSLAEEYLIDESYPSNDARVDALIRWETAKNFTSGFLTGLGGVLTLPVTVPAALGASWVIQARMCAAIARIYGYDLKQDRVRTLVLMAIVGDAGKDVLKGVGIPVARRL